MIDITELDKTILVATLFKSLVDTIEPKDIPDDIIQWSREFDFNLVAKMNKSNEDFSSVTIRLIRKLIEEEKNLKENK